MKSEDPGKGEISRKRDSKVEDRDGQLQGAGNHGEDISEDAGTSLQVTWFSPLGWQP